MPDLIKQAFFGIAAFFLFVGFSLGIIYIGEMRGAESGLENKVSSLASLFSAPEREPFFLTQEDLAYSVKPSVVRIIQHVSGKASIPFFDIDLVKRSVVFQQDMRIPAKTATTSIDEYVAGSGFIVNPDGYILTNAHVVSDEAVKRAVVGAAIFQNIYSKTLLLKSEDEKRITDDPVSFRKFMEDTLEKIEAKSAFDINKKIVVLDPHGVKEKLSELIDGGFPAEVISVNDKFFDDEKDVALIKIDQNNLPALKLGDSQSLAVGRKAYIFSFPATAELNKGNPGEATFSQGIISSIKDSRKKDFKIFQTDAKVSQGSSGGPMLNAQGEAVGLVTFQTNPEQQQGDLFAFAIPIEVAKDVLKGESVENKKGNYMEHFLVGLELMKNRSCKKALAEFALAQNVNEKFTVDKYLAPYIDECEELIEKGKSIDTVWDEVKKQLSGIGYFLWFIIGGLFMILLGLLLAVVKLMSRVKKDEKEISHIEQNLGMEKETGKVSAVEKPQEVMKPREAGKQTPFQEARQSIGEKIAVAEPESKPKIKEIDPRLIKFIKSARGEGWTDELIMNELRKSGWSARTIRDGLQDPDSKN